MTLRSGDALRIVLGVLVISGERSDTACREGIHKINYTQSNVCRFYIVLESNTAYCALGGVPMQ